MMNTLTSNGWKTGAFLVLATMILVFATAAFAQGSGGRFGHGQQGRGQRCAFGPEHRMEMLTEKLDLTEEQVTAIEGIREAGREKNVSLKKEMMRLRHELEGELLKDEPSEKTALDLVEQIGALKVQIQSQRLKNRLEVRRQLTPEQRDKMLMLHGKFGSGSGRGHGQRAGHRDCSHSRGECDGSGPGQARRGPRS